jgi:hypothetical protein
MTDLVSGKYPASYEEWLLDGQPAQPFRSNFSRRATLLAAGLAATAGTGFMVPVVVQQGDVITSVTVGVKTATSSGTIHGWAAIYTGLTTAATLISQAPDNTSGFTSSGSAQTFTLSAPYTVGAAPGSTGTNGPLVLGVLLYNEGTTGGVLDALGQGSEAVAGGVYVTGQVPLLFTKASMSAGATAPATLSGFAAATAGTNLAAAPLVILH